ncbi:MAG: putative Ig domain-containing protein [Thermodesulfobacteriota bacterium]|nr:putative Ig domain-containing protein [Thermodesulfobacteriota bacterium]
MWCAIVFLMILMAGTGQQAVASGTYIKDGVKHYYITDFVYNLADTTTWSVSGGYSKVKIHMCTRDDIEENGGYQDGDVWCFDSDSDSDCDDDDYIPRDDNPDEATVNIMVPLTIAEGVQVEIADDITVVVIVSLTVNGTEQQPVSIDVGKRLSIAGSGDIDWCQIKSGSGDFGGGLFLDGPSSFSLTHSSVSNNQADYGGGIFINGGTGITIEDTEISGNNNVTQGGGLFIAGASPTIRDCVIKSNTDASHGGGIYITGGNPVILNTKICDNSAQYGGGVYVNGVAPLFVNSMVCNNLGTSVGGGFYLDSASPRIISGVVCNNVVKGSCGGGIYGASSSPAVTNTILYGNLVNWYDNQPDDIFTYQQVYPSGMLSGFTACNIQDQATGGGDCMDADPLFAGESGQKGPDGMGAIADWSLSSDSPCINTGTVNHLGTAHDDTDAAGNDRPYNKPGGGSPYAAYADDIKVDIGAYEYQNNPPLLLDGSDNSVTGNIDATAATDEDTDATIALFDGYHAVDVDGDDIETMVTKFPDDVLGDTDDPAVVEYGQLFQFPKGNAINSGSNSLSDGDHRLVFTPANRMADYAARLTGNFSDGACPSTFAQTVTVSVDAVDDPPNFTSNPTSLMIYAGEQFNYSITAENPDVDDTVPPSLGIQSLPDWLSFWDNGDGTGGLLGIADDNDVGDTDVTLLAEDSGGNGNTQSFTITVREQVVLQVDVQKTSVSGAPGDDIALNASSRTMTTNPSFDWTIVDENDNTVATLSGQNATWDTTGMAEGIYSAEVTISDNRGSETDTAVMTISLATGFTETDDDNRTAPDATQADTIDNLDGSSPADVINDMAALDLTADQRDKVAAAIAEKSDDALTETETNYLLGALDNMIIDDPADAGDMLTSGQIDQTLTALLNLADRDALTDMQITKLGEAVDELIAQQGRENLSDAQLRIIDRIQADLAAAAAKSDRALNTGGTHFSLASQPVDGSTGSGPLTLRTGSVAVTIGDVDELKDRTGRTEFCIILTRNTASDLADVPVYTLGLYTTAGRVIALDGELNTPAAISLPLNDTSRTDPLHYDADAGQWDNSAIENIRTTETAVTFDSLLLGDYGLFTNAISPAATTTPAAAGGTNSDDRGSSNCFLQTLTHDDS